MRLATPVLIEQILNVMVGLVDTWLTGNFLPDEAYLAAIGVMAYLMWLIPSLFAGVAIGATALTSRFTGAGEPALANHVMNQSLVLGAALACVITTALGYGGDQLIRLLQLETDASRYASQYLMVLVPFIPWIMLEQVGIACFRGTGDTVTGFVAMTSVNVINVLVSAVLVIGCGPIPAMGWLGVAIGTAAAHFFGGMIILVLLIRGRSGLRIRFTQLRPNMQMIRRLVRIGLPGGVDVISVLACHLWFVGIVNSLGTTSAAAHSLAIRIESLAYLPGTAFQVAAATLAGQYLGAGHKRNASRAVREACLFGGVTMVAAGVLFYFAGESLILFFSQSLDSQTVALTVRLLKLAAFATPALAVSMILTGALRGAGDTRGPLRFTMIGFLGIRIPGTLWLTSQTNLGLMGAWYAMVADIVVRAVLVSWRVWRGDWRETNV